MQNKIIYWQHKRVSLLADKLLKLWIPQNVTLNPFTEVDSNANLEITCISH